MFGAAPSLPLMSYSYFRTKVLFCQGASVGN